MNKKRKVITVLSVALLALVAFSFPAEKYFDIAKSLDIFASVFKEVNTYYVDEVDPKKLVETGITGMLEQLDPYTDYIPEENKEAFSIQTTGNMQELVLSLVSSTKKRSSLIHISDFRLIVQALR
jgi:carboxyl-terminal processing protease